MKIPSSQIPAFQHSTGVWRTDTPTDTER